MANRDVEFVIRAKNEASRAIEAVTSALDALKNIQDGASTSASKMGGVLGELSNEFAALKNQSTGLSALGKVADYLERAEVSVAGLDKRLNESKASLEIFTQEHAKAALATEQLRNALSNVQTSLSGEQSALKTAKTDFSTLSSEIGKLTRSMEAYPAAQERAASSVARLTSLQERQSAALDALRAKMAAMPEPKTEKEAASYQNLADRITRASEALTKTNERISAARSASESLANANAAAAQKVGELSAKQNEVGLAVQRSTSAIAGYKSEITSLKDGLSQASKYESDLAVNMTKTEGAITRQSEGLTRARTALDEMRGTAQGAAQTLGVLGTSTEAVATAAKKTATDLKSVSEVMKDIKSQKGASIGLDVSEKSYANLKALIVAVSESRSAFETARREATDLGRQIAATEAPTRELATAFVLAKAQMDQAEKTFLATGAALADMRGKANGSFAAFDRMVSVLNGTSNAATNTSTTLRSAAGEIRGIGSAGQSAAGGTNALSDAMKTLYGESRQAMSILQRLRGEFLGLIASYTGFQGLQSGFQATISAIRTLEAAQNRLGAAFNQDYNKTADGLNMVRQQSVRLGQSFATTGDEYSKFTIAASEANYTLDGTNKIFRSVAEAARVNKLSTEQLSGVYLALTQMISKGKVTSEELRRQLGDRLPGAFNLMANALKMTTAELDAAMKAGKVFSDEKTLLAFADQLTKRFGSQLPEALKTTTTQLDLFQNNLEQAAQRVALGGFDEELRKALTKLNALFDSRAGRDFFLAIGAAAGRLISVLSLLVENVDSVVKALGAIVAVKVANAIIAMVKGIGQSYVAFEQLRQGATGAAVATSEAGAAAARSSSGFLTFREAIAATSAGLVAFGIEAKSIGLSLVGVGEQTNVVTRVFAGTVGAFATARASLAALGASVATLRSEFTLATAGTVAFRLAAVTIAPVTYAASAAMRVATVAARGLWSALGGLPGILIAIGTYFAGEWIAGLAGNVDDATKSLDEHKRVVDAVAAAYNNAVDKSGEWQRNIKGVTNDQVVANVRKQQEAYDEAKLKAVNYYMSIVNSAKLAGNAEMAQIKNFQSMFGRGSISASQFVKELEKIYAATKNDNVRQYLEGLLSVARGAEEASKRLDEASDAAKKFKQAIPNLDPVTSTWNSFSQTVKTVATWVGGIGGALIGLGVTIRGIATVLSIARNGFVTLGTGIATIGRTAGVIGAVLRSLMTIVSGLAGAFGGLGIAVALAAAAIVAAGVYIYENWAKVKTFFSDLWQSIVTGANTAWQSIVSAASSAWQSLVSGIQGLGSAIASKFSEVTSAVSSFFGSMVSTVKGYIDQIMQWLQGVISRAIEATKTVLGVGSSTNAQKNAEGGHIVGPGSGTSDSILSWLSNGEFVVKARAVARYGVGFLNQINDMRYAPAYASGGLVNPIRRYATGGVVSAPQSPGRPLTLVLDGQSFSGISAPTDVAEGLVRYVQEKSIRSSGRAPNWKGA